jgi:hypothetical protein
MSATPKQARDEILAKFHEAWDADTTSADVPVLYSDQPQEVPDSGAWARITVRHLAGGQVTLSNSSGSRRFRHEGTIFVQIFTPFNDGMELGDDLAMIAQRAFEGEVTSPGRVIFRRVRINEIGQDGQWFQTNVLVDFEYDDIH